MKNEKLIRGPMEKAYRGKTYRQVDVFCEKPLSGNGLAVFNDCDDFSTEVMQALTRELRQFESVFLNRQSGDGSFPTRIFTMEEELAFAGHPILGAAATLHEKYGAQLKETWCLNLSGRKVTVTTEDDGGGYRATMDQGRPEFGRLLTQEEAETFLGFLHIDKSDYNSVFPLQVVSTGLPYLVVPVSGGVESVKIDCDDFEWQLEQVGAKFVYVIDITSLEGRTWDNAGLVEDIATGSAAGPVAAYLYNYNLVKAAIIQINQGRFTGRSGTMVVEISCDGPDIASVFVTGSVRMVATGVFD